MLKKSDLEGQKLNINSRMDIDKPIFFSLDSEI